MVLVFAALLSAGSPARVPDHLQRGSEALDQFRVREALRHLEKARYQGPYDHTHHILLYEKLGIAYAYSDERAAAVRAFKTLLALDPGHAIDYTLSPKVTFLFQKARRLAAKEPAPTIELTWPPTLQVADPIPIYVEVVADPESFLHNAALFTRRKGLSEFHRTSLRLVAPGRSSRVELPAVAKEATEPQALEIFLVAMNAQGSEVLRIGDPRFPRQISLGYEEPLAWYQRWWVWAMVGGVVSVASGVTIYFATYQPPRQIDGTLRMD